MGVEGTSEEESEPEQGESARVDVGRAGGRDRRGLRLMSDKLLDRVILNSTYKERSEIILRYADYWL